MQERDLASGEDEYTSGEDGYLHMSGEDEYSSGVESLAQVQALEALYTAAGGAGWTTKTNWLSGDPCNYTSTWSGVTCSGGEVTSLSLNDNGLTGTLPTQVGLLTAITEWL